MKTQTRAQRGMPARRLTARDREYWVLTLSKGNTRLFKWQAGRLTEIFDKSFPLRYEEQFEIERKTGPRVQYYDDESRINEKRLFGYFRHVGHLLKPYLAAERIPVILMTVNSYVREFKGVTHLEKHVLKNIHGNYDHYTVSALRSLLNKKLKVGITK